MTTESYCKEHDGIWSNKSYTCRWKWNKDNRLPIGIGQEGRWHCPGIKISQNFGGGIEFSPYKILYIASHAVGINFFYFSDFLYFLKDKMVYELSGYSNRILLKGGVFLK